MINALKVEANKAGRRYALISMRNAFGRGEGYSVWAECKNYSAHVYGGISVAWRYCDKNLTLADAERLLARKVAGKAAA